MIPVCDVPSIEYYGILVIPESRLYEFHRLYRVGNLPTTQYITDLNGVSSPSNGVVPLIDRAFSAMNQLNNNNNMLLQALQNELRHTTFGMSFLDQGRALSIHDYEFSAIAMKNKIPFFSSKEKAIEFLMDVSRILNSTNGYIEYRHGMSIKRLPEELSIVKFDIDKLRRLSATATVVINPYVPGFY